MKFVNQEQVIQEEEMSSRRGEDEEGLRRR